MDIDLILLAAIGAIAVLVLLLRTNISLAIMGLCAGYVFSDLLADEIVNLVVTNVDSLDSLPIISVISIGLILTPAVLILFRFATHQRGRFIQHLIPALGFPLLATLLIFSNLPLETTRYLADESVVYQQFQNFEVLIAASVVGIAVVDVVLHEGEHKRKYRKRHRVKDSS